MNKFYEIKKDDFLISDDRSKLDLEMIHQYLSTASYWAKNIPLKVVKRSIENCICFGVYFKDKQVGFAKVISDKATFAYLGDVFILKEYRGQGLSKFLMTAIHAHPDLQNLRRWSLVTADAQGLYRQFDWTVLTEAQSKKYMQKVDEDFYKKWR